MNPMRIDPVKQPEAYIEDLLGKLGNQDPLLVMADTPVELAARLADVDDDRAAERPEAKSWSIREIVGHLADTEWVHGYRIRIALTQNEALQPGYDQDLMVDRLEHNERSLADLLDEFKVLRELNLEMYERMKGEPWSRTSIHAERGEESVERFINLLAGHDLRHLDQVDRTLEALA